MAFDKTNIFRCITSFIKFGTRQNSLKRPPGSLNIARIWHNATYLEPEKLQQGSRWKVFWGNTSPPHFCLFSDLQTGAKRMPFSSVSH